MNNDGLYTIITAFCFLFYMKIVKAVSFFLSCSWNPSLLKFFHYWACFLSMPPALTWLCHHYSQRMFDLINHLYGRLYILTTIRGIFLTVAFLITHFLKGSLFTTSSWNSKWLITATTIPTPPLWFIGSNANHCYLV